MEKITLIGLLFLFIETKELCEARGEAKHEKLTIIPPIWNCQCSEWSLHFFSMQSMRAHTKQHLIGKYKEMSVWHQVNLTKYPSRYIWQRTVWCLHCSVLSLTPKDRYICTKSLLWRQMLRKLSLLNAFDTKYVTKSLLWRQVLRKLLL